MLQRSPTYVVSAPGAGIPVANKLRARLPPKLAYHLIRWRNVLWGMSFFQLSRAPARPRVKQLILGGVRMALGPTTISRPISRRATIPGINGYVWWPTAICSRRSRKSAPSVVTRRIDSFNPRTASRLKDGGELEPTLSSPPPVSIWQVDGGIEVSVDGRGIDFARMLELQGHDVFRHPQSGGLVRLHQRVVDR